MTVSAEFWREMPAAAGKEVARAMAERPDDELFVIFVGDDREKLLRLAERVMWQYGVPGQLPTSMAPEDPA